jgi:hypothetical protein
MRLLTIAALWLAPSLALAQTSPPADSFGPANPQIKSPPASFRSAFGPSAAPEDDATWRQANDEAGRLRGHSGQLRDTTEGAAPPSPAPSGGAAHPGGHKHGN